MSQNIDWIFREPGGRVILIDIDSFKKWRGIEGSSVSSSEKSDDDRAHAIRKAVDIIEASSGECLVFGKGPIINAGWLAQAPAGGVLIFCDQDDTPPDEEVIDIINRAPEKVWKDTKLTFTNKKLAHLLISSFETEASIEYGTGYGAVDVLLDKGTFALKSASYDTEKWKLSFFKFSPIDVKKPGEAAAYLETAQKKRLDLQKAQLKELAEIVRSRSEKALIDHVPNTRVKWTDDLINDVLAWMSEEPSDEVYSKLESNLVHYQKIEKSFMGKLVATRVAREQKRLSGDRQLEFATNLSEFVAWKLENKIPVSQFEIENVTWSAIDNSILKSVFRTEPIFELLRKQLISFARREDLHLLYRGFFALDGIPDYSDKTDIYGVISNLKWDVKSLPAFELDLTMIEEFLGNFDEAILAVARRVNDLPKSQHGRDRWIELLASRTPEFNERVKGSAPGREALLGAAKTQIENLKNDYQNTRNKSLLDGLEKLVNDI